jgi:hypothetical protein
MRITIVLGKVKSMTIFATKKPEFDEWFEIDEFTFQSNPLKQFDTHRLT